MEKYTAGDLRETVEDISKFYMLNHLNIEKDIYTQFVIKERELRRLFSEESGLDWDELVYPFMFPRFAREDGHDRVIYMSDELAKKFEEFKKWLNENFFKQKAH